MAKVTKESVKEMIKVLDELNGTDHYNTIDWNDPSTEIPDFLTEKKDDKKD